MGSRFITGCSLPSAHADRQCEMRWSPGVKCPNKRLVVTRLDFARDIETKAIVAPCVVPEQLTIQVDSRLPVYNTKIVSTHRQELSQ